MQTTVDGLVADGLDLGFPLQRKELERAQMKRLRQTIEHARCHSSLYRKRFSALDVDALIESKDLAQLPFLTGADVVERGHQLHCVSQSEVVRIITMYTSGSTGKPKRFSFTAADLAATSEFFLRGMASLVDQTDRVLVILPFATEASVGGLLVAALLRGGIRATGLWPPPDVSLVSELIHARKITSVVGLPQQLLALSSWVGHGQLRTMLLCSDYAAESLRRRIEQNCGCQTFLHYGATESGLGGAVECSQHCGVHIRESDLLVEIVDSTTGEQLADGLSGEIVLTTIGREAMPLIRYRTGDVATLERGRCACGGVTARLCQMYGRLQDCTLADGSVISSQYLDDILYQVVGLVDYRVTLSRGDVERLDLEYIADSGAKEVGREIDQLLRMLPEIAPMLGAKDSLPKNMQQVERFASTHTLKRTILDLR